MAKQTARVEVVPIDADGNDQPTYTIERMTLDQIADHLGAAPAAAPSYYLIIHSCPRDWSYRAGQRLFGCDR